MFLIDISCVDLLLGYHYVDSFTGPESDIEAQRCHRLVQITDRLARSDNKIRALSLSAGFLGLGYSLEIYSCIDL